MFFKRIELILKSESVLRKMHWLGGNLEVREGFHVPLDK